MRIAFGWLALLVSSGVCAQATVPARFTWESNSDRIAKSEKVAALGNNAFGDSISLSNGSVSFQATDVSLPGNDKLPVEFSRSYTVKNWRYLPADGMLGDWMLDAPRISATFAQDWVVSQSSPGARCSTTAYPERPTTLPSSIEVSDYYQGMTLSLPGSTSDLLVTGSGTTKPSNGNTYRWVTTDGMTHVSCLSTIKNGTGEGFLALTPDGTRYWFDHMAQYQEASLKHPIVHIEQSFTQYVAVRTNVLYATRVEDRFGNYVTYTYSNAWNQPAKLTSIQASDGRLLSLSYSGQFLASVTDGTRMWSYSYANTPNGRRTLTSVTLPDQSAWSIGFTNLTDAEILYSEINVGEPLRTCTMNQIPQNYALAPVGTITHPAGATGTFTFGLLEHGRSNVPIDCSPIQTFPVGAPPGTGNNEGDDENAYTISGYALTLTKKRVSGPGLTTAEWLYSYAPGISVHRWPGTTFSYPRCVLSPATECAKPPCTSDSCAGFSRTTITGPNNSWERHTFGNSYLYNEGKLIKVERGAGATAILQTATNSYDLSGINQVYPAKFGDSQKSSGNGYASAYHRPQTGASIQQDGATFSWAITGFDAFARPLTTTRSSSLGYTLNEETQYYDRPASWVMGQVSRFKQAGLTPALIGYDSTTALPLTYTAFGKLVQTLTWNADGTVASVKDGRNKITTLSSWYRGVPRTVGYPDSTSQTAVVNGLGWITSTTDENGFATSYTHDAMGRLASVTYPAGDSTAWNAKTLQFQRVTSSEYGIPGGHWRQTTTVGNKVSVAYLDALWRPVVTRQYDAANVAGTQTFQREAYDHEGRQTFASYPGTSDALTTGIWTTYDSLGRTTAVVQNSEQGDLYTLTDYLAGFKTRVTNPKGYQTTTSFMAWDRPSNDLPVAIVHPEGAYTDIARDALGKPTRITRRNANSSVSVNRQYVYNSDQLLCKTIEPETGATVLDYDNAGNLAWSAGGQNYPSLTSCNTGDVPANQRVSRNYDARNRLYELLFPDGRGNQSWAYTPDGLPYQITTYNSAGGETVINAYTYNKRRLLTGESVAQPGWYTWSLGYGYDANGSIASLTYPKGRTYVMSPNALGQATQVALQGGPAYASGVSYFPNGAIKQFTYGNGIVHTMSQNARQLPARSTDQGGGNPLDLGYSYDKNGNVAGITDYTSTGRQTRTMGYDALDRLTTTHSAMFGGDGVATFAYDVLDNLKRFKVGATDNLYSYNAKNQLQTVNRQSDGVAVVGLGYDARGNLANKNGLGFSFDYGNRLREVSGVEGYRYDAHGRRVLNWSPTLGSTLSFYGQDGVLRFQDAEQGKSTDYLYLGGSLIAKVTVSTQVVLPPASAPVISVPASSTSGAYTVSWNGVGTATRYPLEERVNGGGWTQVQDNSAGSWSTSGKTPATYGYRVRACNDGGCSGYSATKSVVVSNPIPSPPTNLRFNYSVMEVNRTRYVARWDAVASATSYELNGSIAYTGPNLTYALVRNAAPDTSASVYVRACNSFGCSAWVYANVVGL